MIRSLIIALSLATAAPAQTVSQAVAPPVVLESPLAVASSLRPRARRAIVAIPDARWDGRGGRKSWTLAAIQALRGHADTLPEIVPNDIEAWCPAYPSAGETQREAFWVGLLSTLAKHESTYRPTAVGGGGRWFGLVQIAPATARAYGCKARNGQALKDPEDNLSCALRIMARTVARDQVVSHRMRGVAADWGPFHSRKKREDMRTWTRKQTYCTATVLARSLRPVIRPEGLGVIATPEIIGVTPDLAQIDPDTVIDPTLSSRSEQR